MDKFIACDKFSKKKKRSGRTASGFLGRGQSCGKEAGKPESIHQSESTEVDSR